MPRFCRFLCGPRVTVRPQVINGPASSGQHVWIGRRARSTSRPSHTISWHGPELRSFGAMSSTFMNTGRVVRQASIEALRRRRLLQEREQFSNLAQRRPPVRGIGAHRLRDALRRAEQVAEHRDRRTARRAEGTGRILEQQRGTVRAQGAIAERRHLELRIDSRANARKVTRRFELTQEFPQVGISHRMSLSGRSRRHDTE